MPHSPSATPRLVMQQATPRPKRAGASHLWLAGALALALLLAACGGGSDEAAHAGHDMSANANTSSTPVSGGHDHSKMDLAMAADPTWLATARVPRAFSVCFYEGVNYTGASFCTGSTATAMPAGFSANVSSVRVSAGFKLTLYNKVGLAGTAKGYTADAASLATTAFDNATLSFLIAPTSTVPAPYLWSRHATWGGSLPIAGEHVHVPAGFNLSIDSSSPSLGYMMLSGAAQFTNAAINLQAKAILIRSGGSLLAGNEASRQTAKTTITLTDTATAADPSGMGMGTRGIIVYSGGKLELYGTPPATPWTRLAAHADVGSKSLSVLAASGWKPGDTVAVAPTEWYPLDPWAQQSAHNTVLTTERFTLSAISGTTLTISAGLGAFKWGLLQYITDAGLSLSPGTFTAPHADAARVLDQRAEVANLTRNIVIEAVNDASFTSGAFGGQVMVMDRTSSLKLDGVELRRMGQAGKLGRYPIHWHGLSYNTDTGAQLGDATGHFVRNSVVWNSTQRCMVIHNTNGVELRNNICHDIRGHAFFIEDGTERRNVIEGNLALRVRTPEAAVRLTNHEAHANINGCGGGAAGFWITNPDNTLRNNAASDAQGNGFWLSYATTPFNLGAKVLVRPANLPHGPFEFNSARANGNFGLMLECPMIDNAGVTNNLKYLPTLDGSAFQWWPNNSKRFSFKAIALHKNRMGGYQNRASVPDYVQFSVADNRGRAFTGAVDAGTLKHSLVVGLSLNNRQAYPPGLDPQLGVASYHSQIDVAQNTFVNLSNQGYLLTSVGWDKSSGAFGTDDYYTRAVDKGFSRNPGNKLINADPGYRALPPHMQPGYVSGDKHTWTLAGALWDPHGVVGAAGRWWVLPSPFLNQMGCSSIVSKAPVGRANGWSCPGPYFGFIEFWLNRNLPGDTGAYVNKERMEVTRLNSSNQELGRWFLNHGYEDRFGLGHMRHFAAVAGGGRYVVRFPSFPQSSSTKVAPSWVQFQAENLLNAGDSVTVGVHYTGAKAPGRVYVSANADWPNFQESTVKNARLLSAAASLAAVEAGNGTQFWQDKAAQLIWVKLVPLNLSGPWVDAPAGSDAHLYKPYVLRIEP